MKLTVPRAAFGLLLTALVLALAACGSGNDSAATSANAVDRAFVAQMIPHHELAVQMAQEAQRLGEHAQVKALAGSIISSQRGEITTMSAIARDIKVTPAQPAMSGMGHEDTAMADDARALGLTMDQMGMSMDMAALTKAKPFDRMFLTDMIPHHQGAIRMARAELARGRNAGLIKLARQIITAQDKEIASMRGRRAAWYGD